MLWGHITVLYHPTRAHVPMAFVFKQLVSFVDSFLIQTNNARSTPAYSDDFLCQIRSTFTIRPNSIRRLHSPHITKTFLHVLFVCTYHFSTADIRIFNNGLVPALSYYFLTQNPMFMISMILIPSCIMDHYQFKI